MRKFIFTALIGLGMGIPASQSLLATPSYSLVLQELDQEIDSRLVEQILRAAEQSSEYDYNCLCDMYINGDLTISKVVEGYLVSISDGEGGVGQILIDEGF